jgi:hypothetical protein
MMSEAGRQPMLSAIAATGGRMTSCPVACPAVSTPITSPRRVTNQRSAMVAASTSAIDPVPPPMSTPQKIRSCHEAVMKTLPAAPSATSASAIGTTRRRPKRSIRAAAKGATRP